MAVFSKPSLRAVVLVCHEVDATARKDFHAGQKVTKNGQTYGLLDETEEKVSPEADESPTAISATTAEKEGNLATTAVS